MYVCVCNAVRAAQIQEALERGCTSMEGLRTELGLGNGCGSCVEYARAMIEDRLQKPAESSAFIAA